MIILQPNSCAYFFTNHFVFTRLWVQLYCFSRIYDLSWLRTIFPIGNWNKRKKKKDDFWELVDHTSHSRSLKPVIRIYKYRWPCRMGQWENTPVLKLVISPRRSLVKLRGLFFGDWVNEIVSYLSIACFAMCLPITRQCFDGMWCLVTNFNNSYLK